MRHLGITGTAAGLNGRREVGEIAVERRRQDVLDVAVGMRGGQLQPEMPVLVEPERQLDAAMVIAGRAALRRLARVIGVRGGGTRRAMRDRRRQPVYRRMDLGQERRRRAAFAGEQRAGKRRCFLADQANSPVSTVRRPKTRVVPDGWKTVRRKSLLSRVAR